MAKTTHNYINDYKERLREAFGEYSGAAENKDSDSDEVTDKRHIVEGILAEPTPSELVENDPAQDEQDKLDQEEREEAEAQRRREKEQAEQQ